MMFKSNVLFNRYISGDGVIQELITYFTLFNDGDVIIRCNKIYIMPISYVCVELVQ